FLHAVHRIDKDVSGMILFAKSAKALKRLNEMMKSQFIRRIYLAEIEGEMEKKEGVLEHFLVRKNFKATVCSSKTQDAKKAVLQYSTESKTKLGSILKIELKTGRYHQIRLQLSATGHPIIGDKKYGSSIISDQIHLHMAHLIFNHPVTKDEISIQSKPFFIKN
ncbi:MAG TPA: RNA pseudouridine synthase, partial [Chlamydiales bacterium]|nr:RNA pseudouridine synthase [Chlamydiales bacterium]